MNFDSIKAILNEWAAIIIAISAVFIAVWQGIEARSFNRKSLTPHIDIILSSNQENVAIKVVSNGTGPAIIKSFILNINGENFDGLFCEQVYTASSELGISGFVKTQCFSENEFLSPGMEKKLIWLSVVPMQLKPHKKLVYEAMEKRRRESGRRDFIKAIKKLEIIAKYESIYGQEFIEKFKSQRLLD